MLAAFAVSVLLAFTILPSADANVFLGRSQESVANDPEFQRALLTEMEQILGSEHRAFTDKRLQHIEDNLRQLFVAMPKTSQGKLQHAAVGYVMHRAFVQRHGWLVRNLAPEGKSLAMWNESAPTSVLENRVGQDVIDVLESRMGGGGTGLHEVAVLTATLEHLVHKEALERLRLAYEAHGFKADDVLSADEVDAVLEGYMALYILGGYLKALKSSAISPQKVLQIQRRADDMYPNFPETRKYMQGIKHRMAPKRDYLYFADVANIIEEAGEHFGEFQDRECIAMKDQLAEMELPGAAGRVRLSDFYQPAVHKGEFAFTESVDYLRQLGALDESDPGNPRVIIANYVNSPSNCVAASSFYSVCCRDECEGLLSHLEHELKLPDASATQIRSLVEALPSRTEKANRTLSPWLLDRLEDVAAHNSGRVPIHGRLFAQWMHYAYPRECPYPHVSGAISPDRLEDMLAAQADVRSVMASLPEMTQHVNAPPNATTIDDDASMWTLEEELLVTRPEMAPSLAPIPASLFSTSLRGLALAGAVFSIFGMTSRSGLTGLCSPAVVDASQKYMV